MSNPTTFDSSLVVSINGESRTNTLIIADGIETDHASVIKLVRTYLADLEEFGVLYFKSETNFGGGGRPTEYAELNERQSTLLLSYMRNTEIVRTFKKRLVHRFFEMAEQLRNVPSINLDDPSTLKTLLLANLQKQEEQKVQIEQRDKLISNIQPKADVCDRLIGAEGNLNIRNAAKALKMKEQKFVDWLQIKHFAYRNRRGRLEAYAEHIPRYLDHKVQPIPSDTDPDRVSFQMMITPEGLVKFAKLLNVELNQQEIDFKEAA